MGLSHSLGCDMARTPTREEVRDRVATLVHEIAGVARTRISDEATVDNELELQSVTFVELQVAIEDEYNIQVDPIRVVELNSFGAIVDYIHSTILEGTA